MAYVGNNPSRGQWRKLTDISGSFNGVTTTFTTSVPPGTSQYYVTAGSASQLIISLGGVIQEPDVNYTVSTNSITFATPPAAGLSFFGILCGDALNAGVPADGSVTTSKLGGNLTVDLASGSAATPSLTFDANTGVYSPGEDQVAISTGGSGRLFINSSGSVGIGTSVPYAPLQVNGAIRSTFVGDGSDYIGWGSGGGSAKYAYIAATNEGAQDVGLSFNVTTNAGSSNIEAIRIDDLGNVGIGTTTVDAPLEVRKSGAGMVEIARFSNYNVDGHQLGISVDDDNNLVRYDSTGNSSGGHLWRAGITERMRLTASGQLLVGTSTSRTYALYGQLGVQIESTGFAQSSLGLANNQASTDSASINLAKSRGTALNSNTIVANGDTLGNITFQGADGSALIAGASISAAVDGAPGSGDMPGRLVFSTTADGASSPTERMRITQSGVIKASNTGSYRTTDTRNEFSNSASALPVLETYASATDYTSSVLQISAARNTTNASYNFIQCSRIGIADALRVLDSGNVQNANNSYGAISDVKLKENIVDATSQWSDIKNLQVRKYNFKEETGQQTHTQIGLVAQEVELVSPGLVSESPDRDAEGNDLGTTTKSVNYSVLYMKAVKALQEAMERIETLEAKVAALESA